MGRHGIRRKNEGHWAYGPKMGVAADVAKKLKSWRLNVTSYLLDFRVIGLGRFIFLIRKGNLAVSARLATVSLCLINRKLY